MSQRTATVMVALVVLLTAIVVARSILGATLEPYLNRLAGWPPELTENQRQLALWGVPVMATRPSWVGATVTIAAGVAAIPLTLLAMKIIMGVKSE